jgi:hypothetical protein
VAVPRGGAGVWKDGTHRGGPAGGRGRGEGRGLEGRRRRGVLWGIGEAREILAVECGRGHWKRTPVGAAVGASVGEDVGAAVGVCGTGGVRGDDFRARESSRFAASAYGRGLLGGRGRGLEGRRRRGLLLPRTNKPEQGRLVSSTTPCTPLTAVGSSVGVLVGSAVGAGVGCCARERGGEGPNSTTRGKPGGQKSHLRGVGRGRRRGLGRRVRRGLLCGYPRGQLTSLSA